MSVSIVILLTLLVAAAVKTGALKIWQAVVGGVWGFYIALSSIGPTVGEGLSNFFTWFGSLNF